MPATATHSDAEGHYTAEAGVVSRAFCQPPPPGFVDVKRLSPTATHIAVEGHETPVSVVCPSGSARSTRRGADQAMVGAAEADEPVATADKSQAASTSRSWRLTPTLCVNGFTHPSLRRRRFVLTVTVRGERVVAGKPQHGRA